MPASLRAHVSRVAAASRPYDRRSPTASPVQLESPLVHALLSPSVPPTSPIQTPDVDADPDQNPDGDVDVPQDRPGLPTYADYKRIETSYLLSLSPRKRDKALITQAMFDKIWDVLHQPEACTVETPQFRFWVRKMFRLSRPAGVRGGNGWWGEARAGATGTGSKTEKGKGKGTAMGTGTALGSHSRTDPDPDADETDELERSMGISRSTTDDLAHSAVVLHENRPVAIMEQLYELFCYCHVRAGHGGRDKTCAVIREHYSWVPKELTAQFVKACPTCAVKRSGHMHGLGLDVGVLTHTGREVVRRGKKRRTVAEVGVEVEEMAVEMEPLGLGWPTTGGPLDPANPEPCGVRERLRAREDVGTVGSLSPASPAREMSCLVSGWNNILNASPFRLGDPLGHSFTIKGNREGKENRSPTKTGPGLPSLASALSNESLDDNLNLSVNLSGRSGDGAECPLPPALRPLRLWGPVPPDAEPDLPGPPKSSQPFQIDPVLLSFNYPGLRLSAEPGFASDAHNEDTTNLHRTGHDLVRLRAPSDTWMSLPALDPSRELDSPDSSFERTASYTGPDGDVATLPFSISTEFMARSRCGSRYGYRDGPRAMVYPWSADVVGRELDEPLSLSIVTDA